MINNNVDYYEILEVHPKASHEVIQNAYKTLAKKYHPDVFQGDLETANRMMALINQAYSILSIPEKRKQYDNFLKGSNEKIKTETESEVKNNSDNLSPELRRIILARNIAALSNEEIIEKPNISLYRFNGIGTTFLGEEDYDMYSDSYITRYWFTFLYFPLFSLGRYRVIKRSDSYIIISKVNKRQYLPDFIFSYIKQPSFITWAVILFIVACISIAPQNNTQSKPVTTAKQQTKSQQPPIQLPNPKAGVKTQYAPEEPILNDSGLCQITIDNTRNDFPVMVRIWNISNSPRPVRTFTIRQNEQFTAENLNPGKYEVRYVHLYENSNSKTAYKSESINLIQRDTPSGTEYSKTQLTLYKVAYGNTHTYDIPLTDL